MFGMDVRATWGWDIGQRREALGVASVLFNMQEAAYDVARQISPILQPLGAEAYRETRLDIMAWRNRVAETLGIPSIHTGYDLTDPAELRRLFTRDMFGEKTALYQMRPEYLEYFKTFGKYPIEGTPEVIGGITYLRVKEPWGGTVAENLRWQGLTEQFGATIQQKAFRQVMQSPWLVNLTGEEQVTVLGNLFGGLEKAELADMRRKGMIPDWLWSKIELKLTEIPGEVTMPAPIGGWIGTGALMRRFEAAGVVSTQTMSIRLLEQAKYLWTGAVTPGITPYPDIPSLLGVSKTYSPQAFMQRFLGGGYASYAASRPGLGIYSAALQTNRHAMALLGLLPEDDPLMIYLRRTGQLPTGREEVPQRPWENLIGGTGYSPGGYVGAVGAFETALRNRGVTVPEGAGAYSTEMAGFTRVNLGGYIGIYRGEELISVETPTGRVISGSGWNDPTFQNLPGMYDPVTGRVTVLAQQGLDMIVSRPTTIVAGERGPEHVKITPLSGGRSSLEDRIARLEIESMTSGDSGKLRRAVPWLGRQLTQEIAQNLMKERGAK
jgi:hypothetical protein